MIIEYHHLNLDLGAVTYLIIMIIKIQMIIIKLVLIFIIIRSLI